MTVKSLVYSSHQPALNTVHWPEERTQEVGPAVSSAKDHVELPGGWRYTSLHSQLCLVWGLH